MPDTAPDAVIYIWYHAEAALEPELHAWLIRVRDRLGYAGALFRRDTPEKTTFMEVYGHVDPAAAERIEALAAAQPWKAALQSPRRCEAFVPVFRVEND
jgi:Domain of unknown function (DUF4936)